MVATREEMKHSMLMMQERQTKTTAKMTVAEVIITAHSVVSPQVRSAQFGRKAARRMCRILASTTLRTRGRVTQKTQTNSHQTPHGLTILFLKMTIVKDKVLKIISRRRKMPWQLLNGPHMLLKRS